MDRANTRSVGYAAEAPDSSLANQRIKASTRNQIADALNDAENLTFRVKQTVGQLCGFIPEPCEGVGHGVESQGVLPELSDASVRLKQMIREAHEELDRLQSHFE